MFSSLWKLVLLSIQVTVAIVGSSKARALSQSLLARQGESTKTTDGNTPESRAQDLYSVLWELHVSRCVLVGWWQGAQDVAVYVQQFGTDKLAGVVFVGGPVSFGPAEIDIHKGFSRIILSSISVYAAHPEEYSEGMVKLLFKKPHPDLDMTRIVKSTMLTPTDTGIAMLVRTRDHSTP